MTAIDQDTLLRDAEERFHEGQDMEDVLRFLRANGCSVIESIKATMRLTGASLAEAKVAVHTSDAWSDQRTAHDEFHDMLAESVESLRSGRP